MNCTYKGIDYTGQIVGCYKVLSFDQIKQFPSGQTQKYWNVACIKCGNEKTLSCVKVVGKYQNGCSACVKERFGGPKSFNWNNQNVEHVPGMYFHKIKKSAEKRNLEFNVDREYLDKLFSKQNGKCAYTGYDLTFETGRIRGTASVDRIDSKKGYVIGNIHWVHKDVNVIKWDLCHDRFIELCKTITENHEKNASR